MPDHAWQSVQVLFWILFAALTAIVVYDVYMLLSHDNTATISHGMWCLGRTYRLFPAFVMFVVGAVVGGLAVHFWTAYAD